MTNAEQTAAIADLRATLDNLSERLEAMSKALTIIERRIAPVAPMLPEQLEAAQRIEASDLLGTDEGAE